MRLIFSIISLFASFAALAAHPGKVDFDDLMDLRDANVIAQVNLSGWLMNILQSAAETDQDAAILAGIDEITVRVLELEGNGRRYRNLAATLHEELGDQGWDDLAQVNDDGDVVHIMVKGDAALLEGLTVMVVDDGDEAVFVNMAGAIDPADIARLMRNVRVDGRDGIDIDLDF